VVENSPEELRQEFTVVEESGGGWEEAVKRWLRK